jgi:hypothetical protein
MNRTILASVAAPLLAHGAAAPPASDTGDRVHIRRTGELVVSAPLERAFPLFTPEGERLWAAGWNPLHQFPADGTAVAGAVFSTVDGEGRTTLWLIVDWQPERHHVRYARITPGHRAGTVEVDCRARDERSTTVRVTYELTSLSRQGDEELATWTESWYRGFLADWEREIAAALGGA